MVSREEFTHSAASEECFGAKQSIGTSGERQRRRREKGWGKREGEGGRGRERQGDSGRQRETAGDRGRQRETEEAKVHRVECRGGSGNSGEGGAQVRETGAEQHRPSDQTRPFRTADQTWTLTPLFILRNKAVRVHSTHGGWL